MERPPPDDNNIDILCGIFIKIIFNFSIGMKKLYLVLLCISFFCRAIALGQNNIDPTAQKVKSFIIQFGGFVQHSFPLAMPNNNIGLSKFITTSSRKYIIDNGFEFYIGYKLNDKFDLFTGTRLSFNWLNDNKDHNCRDFNLEYRRIYLPLKARFHLNNSHFWLDCIELEMAWSKILSPVFGWESYSMADAGWHKDKLDYLNNKNPFNISVGIGKSCTLNRVTFFASPYFQYDLNRNEILKGFYHTPTLGIKIIGEYKL